MHKQSGAGARKHHATVLLSGGLDSAAAAVFLLQQGYDVQALFVEYGQPALAAERIASKAVALSLDLRYETVAVQGIPAISGFLLGRNGLFLMLGLARFPPGAASIAMGIHAGTPYPDCTEGFVREGQALLDLYTGGQARFIAPFVMWNKAQVVKYLVSTRPDIPRITFSCERAGETECGSCPSCLDLRRLRACQII